MKRKSAHPAHGLAKKSQQRPVAKRSAASTAWDDQADWYSERHGSDGDANHRNIIIPALLRHIDARPGKQILDVACGHGVVSRALARQGASVMGIDASSALIETAESQASTGEQYQVADACQLAASCPGPFDAAVCVLAMQDIEDISAVCREVAQVLQPGAPFAVCITHPCFRVPRASDWSWDERRKSLSRQVEAYVQSRRISIETRPGIQGDASRSAHFHRPLGAYISAMGAAGLPIQACEELCVPFRGTEGKRSQEEKRMAAEIPVFCVLVGQRQKAE